VAEASNRRELHEILSAVDAEVQKGRNLKAVLQVLDHSRQDIFLHFRRHVDSSAAAQAVTLKVQNLCLAKYHYLAQSSTVLSRPFGLIVDPSNFCNLQCPGCIHSPTAKPERVWETGTLGMDNFSAFLRRYGSYATHITLCNYGEPLLNRSTPAFIQLAKKYLLRTMLSTNLSVGRFDANAYVEAGLDFLVMSIDGATQPVYQQFRRNGNIELVFQNIRKLVEAKRRLGKQTPILNWQFLAFNHNQHEIPLAIETARDLGVDLITISRPGDVSWDVPEIRLVPVDARTEVLNPGCSLGNNWNPFPNALEAETIAREFDSTWMQRLPALDDGLYREPDTPSAHTCRWLYTNMTMDANRQILPCCGPPLRPFDLDFGTFGMAGGAEVFNSEKYRISRRHFAGVRQTSPAGSFQIVNQVPHCVNCEWNQESPNTGPTHVEQYLTDVPESALDAVSMRILSSW
jgi:pyruvate-formate lyase-activating enzyme